MKTMRFTCLGKAFLTLSGGMLLSALLCIACSDGEYGERLPGKTIGFNVTASQGAVDVGTKHTSTRTAADTLPRLEITAMDGEADGEGRPLYLHTLTEEGITADDGMEDGATTKAAPVTTATMHADATVFAAVYPSTDTWNGTVAPGYIFDTQVKEVENWATTYYWPGTNKRVAFFAYAPHHCTGMSLISSASTPGAPKFSYTVPADVTAQTDLLTASSVDVPGMQHVPAPLTFKHALTAVRFEAGTGLLPGTVTKIMLKGVYRKANYKIGETAWSAHTSVGSFEQALNVTTPDPNVPGTELTPEAATFMMLPQTLPGGARIEVVYKDKLTNRQRTLKANIAGKTWPMGKTITYRISTGSIVITPTLEVTPPADYAYQGGNGKYYVRSYASVTGGGSTANVPIAWEAEFSEDGVSWNSTKPAWLTAFTESGAGGTSPSTYTATVAAQVNSAPADPHYEALKNATPVNNYDLSTHDGQGNTVPMSTANCYIVNAPGTYRLPLVYGNAVKGGTANTSAYMCTGSSSYKLERFVNHLGAAITDPYIYNNANCTPASCTLVWQDEPNLVTDVALSSDGHFLEFTVGQATIRQGNAVVAVRNASNTVMWSWHIWVTDYKLGTGLKTITNHMHLNCTLMPVNLGWCDGKTEIYAERTVQVRFKQKPTAGYTPAATETFIVKQKAHTMTKSGNNTYYQWGRKDPFWGAIENPKGGNSIEKTYYTADGRAWVDNRPIPVESVPYAIWCIAWGIRRPMSFSANLYMDKAYNNLWNMTIGNGTTNNQPMVKTIYDPCPAGYSLPVILRNFTGFSKTGNNVVDINQMNVQQPWDKGWNFYCSPSNTSPGSPTVFLPAMGGRHARHGSGEEIGTMGQYWVSAPTSQEQAQHLFFVFEGLRVYASANRSYGFAVRAAQEE
ncbi:fimbrillin family protein [Bacteroides heparinolyticus]|uniref:fimbrillin family protein n=1 Tax=Prevotella heparinolytica TaxID=28113 RepID=UPI0028E53DDB|nr:fimbrillin family protein [Bacteroides heparinolyticus]